jgi:hypothetical protein
MELIVLSLSFGLTFNLLLKLQLLQEVFMSVQNAVWVTCLTVRHMETLTGFFLSTGKQFHSWVPSNWLFGINSGFEGLHSDALRLALLSKLIGSVAEHHSLVVSNRSLGPVNCHGGRFVRHFN